MYTIFADEQLIYTPDAEELTLYHINLNLEDNTAGTLTFSVIPEHPCFTSLQKLKTILSVYRNEQIIFKGRIIDDTVDLYNIKKIQCEGKLAFFNDSVFPEFNFSGSPEELFQRIIENHNNQVSEKQQFRLGRVTVVDNNDYIVRSSEAPTKTWRILKEKCFQSTLGGHIQIRYMEDGDYIDWLLEYEKFSGQKIAFGENMVDLLVDTSATATFTAIRPQGALINEKRIDISSVNQGKDYIIDDEKAADYGIIFAEPEDSVWDDVTLPKNLLTKAREKLEAGKKLKKTIEVKAVDLNLTNSQTEALDVCTYVNVISEIHHISEYYLLSKAEIALDEPQNTKFTLGAVKATLTDAAKQQRENIIRTVGETIPKAVSQLDNDKQYVNEEKVKEILNESSVAPSITIHENTKDSYSLLIDSAAGIIITPNLLGKEGQQGERGVDGKSAYELAVQNGFTGTETEWLESMQGADGQPGEEGQNGKSAYQIAQKNGFSGTEAEWLGSLHGSDGTAPTIEVGAVITGEPGTEATVVNTGTNTEVILNFTIPRGANGSAGGTGSEEGSQMFAFEIRQDGHLWIVTETMGEDSKFHINENGHLIYQVGGT